MLRASAADRPANRAIEAGELYILDLGPAFRGYFADNTRVTAVGRHPTDEQCRAWQHILPVFDMIERKAKPGKSCRELFQEAFDWLNRAAPGNSPITWGMASDCFPHEAPHLNPELERYVPSGRSVCRRARACTATDCGPGIRLENNYLVTEYGRRAADALSDGTVACLN